jgi:hypothetical protein
MKRSNAILIALASAAVATQALGAVFRAIVLYEEITGSRPLPAGPHIVLTVPVSLQAIPAQADHYRIRCAVTHGPTPIILRDPTAEMPQYAILGTGEAVGSIAAPPGSAAAAGTTVRFDAEVGVFLAPKGQTINTPDGHRGMTTVSNTLDYANWYRCALYLESTAWSVTTPLLGDSQGALPYQGGESAFPIAANATYVRIIAGVIAAK